MIIGLLLFLPLLTSAEPVHGHLCISSPGRPDSPSCADMDTETAKVPVSGEPRSFVWRAKDGTAVAAGVVSSGSNKVRPSSISTGSAVDVKWSDASGSPDRIRFSLQQAATANSWSWQMTSAEATRLRELRVEQGDYIFTAESKQFRKLEKALSVKDEMKDAPFSIFLERIPLLSGEVIDSEQKLGISGATIALPDTKVLGRTDRDGRFEIDAPVPWPDYLIVRAENRGSAIAKLPRMPRDTRIAPVVLHPNAKVTIRVGVPRRLSAELVESSSNRRVASVDEAERDGIVFSGLNPGRYRAILKGGPLQQYAVALEVMPGQDQVVDAFLQETDVEIRVVTDEDQPIPEAKVHLSHETGRWTGELVADALGMIQTKIWQQGRFNARVFPPNGAGATVTTADLTGDHRILWVAKLSARRIRGRTVDAESGSPVADVRIHLSGAAVGGQGIYVTTSGEDGNFEFAGLSPGELKVDTAMIGYAEYHAVHTVSDSEQDIEIRLERARRIELRVRTAQGPPIQAAIIDLSAGFQRQLTTSSEGSIWVPLGGREIRTIYVIASDGSFLPITLQAEHLDPNQPFIVRMPLAASTLRVRTIREDGNVAVNAKLVVRFNGYILPPAVHVLLHSMHGNRLQTGADGTVLLSRLPSGDYEVWASTNNQHTRSLFEGATPAGVKATLTAGERTLTVPAIE